MGKPRMIFIIGKHNWCKKNLAFYMYVSTFSIVLFLLLLQPTVILLQVVMLRERKVFSSQWFATSTHIFMWILWIAIGG